MDDRAARDLTLPEGAVRVLDHGFVHLVETMGGDHSIVQAARISYGEGTISFRRDRELIRYLMRNRHTSPFEMVEAKFLIRCPMDVWRQWVRHRTANVNEYSTRYSEAIDVCARTPPDGWRTQSSQNKQGSGEYLPVDQGRGLTALEAGHLENSRKIYEERLAAGVAKEQARKDLPLSTYTEAYWKIDLHNLLHFLQLRMDEHAQLEIRQYAAVIGGMVAKWCPIAWEAFEDYRLNAMTLSALEIEAIRRLFTKGANSFPADINMTDREFKEFAHKIERIGIHG